jgi:hypothetical protein
MMVSLSGPNYDKIRRRLEEQGISDPSGKEVVDMINKAEMDWSLFGFEYRDPTPEEESQSKQQEAERSELATIRADYQWIKECEVLSIEKLREIVVDKPSNEADEHYRKRHRQAVIVLEARETGYDSLAPRIC